MFEFIHPVSQLKYNAKSLSEAQSLLGPHLITSEDLCRFMKLQTITDTETKFAFQALLNNEHGYGAQLCARIHSKCLRLLNDAEMHFDSKYIESYKE